MKALTLIQPWAWTIVSVPEPRAKRIENRSWKPPPKFLNQLIAIHAGRKYDLEDARRIERMSGLRPPAEDAIARGAIVGVARLARVFEDPLHPDFPPGQVRWFFGPYGWLLEDVVEVHPFECPGALGLWDVSETILPHLRPVNEDAAVALSEKFWSARP